MADYWYNGKTRSENEVIFPKITLSMKIKRFKPMEKGMIRMWENTFGIKLWQFIILNLIASAGVLIGIAFLVKLTFRL